MAAGGGKEMEIAIKIAGKVESSFKNALGAATKGLGGIAKAAGAATAAAASAVASTVVGLGKAAVGVGMEFETSMSGLAATAGIDAGSEQYQRLEDAAREMGRATSKSAAESADALQYMALAGWSVDDSIKGLPSILHLSEASGMDLAQTSDMVTDTMSALGVSINELPAYLDVVAKAQNTTNQSAEQLMDAYLGVGGTLKSLGVSTKESASALGVLANRGTKGSEAGTALNAIMVNLTTGAGQAGKAMDALGVSAFDSEGNFIGLKATLEKVNGATKGMTQEERNAALAAIGGKQHLDSLQKLMAGLNDTTADGTQEWEAITQELNNAGGALEEMRDRKVDNLAGDIDVIKSAASDLGISIYKDVNTPLRNAAQFGTEMITELNNAYSSGGMEGMVSAVGGCLSKAVNKIQEHAPEIINMGVGLLESFISGITENSGASASAAAKAMSAFMEGLFSIVPQAMLAGVDVIIQIAQGVTAQLPQLINSGAQTIASFVNGIIQRLPEVISTALTLVQTLVNSIGQNAPMLISAAIQLIGNLVLGIVSMLPQLLQMGIQLILNLAQGIIANLPLLLEIATQIIVNLVDSITQGLPYLIQGGFELITSLIHGIAQNLPAIAKAAVTIILSLIGGLITAIPQLWAAAKMLPVKIKEAIIDNDWLEIGWNLICSIGEGIIDGALSIGSSVLNTVKGWFGFGDDSEDSGKEASDSFVSGINDSAGAVTAASGSMATNVFGNMDISSAAAAGTQAGTAFSMGLTGSMATGGFDTAAFGENMTDMGTTGATALRTGFSAVIAGTPVDTNSVLDTSTLNADMTAAGTDGATALAAGLNTGLSGAAINAGAMVADTSGLTANLAMAGTDGAAAIGTGMTGNTHAVTQAATTIGTDISAALDSEWQKANTNAQTAMQSLVTTVTNATRVAANAVKAAFENMTITIPKPKIPVISVTTNPVAYGKGGNVSIPEFSVAWNAMGGIFEQPTIFNTAAGMQGVGEAGPEAILPLDTLWAKMRGILNEAVAASGGPSLIDAFIEKLKGIGTGGGGGQPGSAGTGAPAIQYSPVYNLYGNAGKEEAAEAGRMSQAEFNKMLRQCERDRQRRKL